MLHVLIKKYAIFLFLTLSFNFLSNNQNLVFIFRRMRLSYTKEMIFENKTIYERYLYRISDSTNLDDIKIDIQNDAAINLPYAVYDVESGTLFVFINPQLEISESEQIKMAGQNIELSRDRVLEKQIAEKQIALQNEISLLLQQELVLREQNDLGSLRQVWQDLAIKFKEWSRLMKQREDYVRKGRIDPHTHSNLSDAPDYVTPEELLRQAVRTGVRTIGASEHNTINGALALQDLAMQMLEDGMIIDSIPGTIEVSLQVSSYDVGTHKDIHLRLEFADFTNPEVISLINELRAVYRDGFKKAMAEFMEIDSIDMLKEKIKERNLFRNEDVEFSDEEIQEILDVIQSLKEHPENHEVILDFALKNENLARGMQLAGLFEEDKYRLFRNFTYYLWIADAEGYFYDGVEFLRKLRQVDPGATAILCHPFWHIEDTEKLVSFLSLSDPVVGERLIDGMEVSYAYYLPEQQEILRGYAQVNNLWMSGGSDSHNLDKADRSDGRLGSGYSGNVNVAWEMLSNSRNKRMDYHYQRAMVYYDDFIKQADEGIFNKELFELAVAEFSRSSVSFTSKGYIFTNPYAYSSYECLAELYRKAASL